MIAPMDDDGSRLRPGEATIALLAGFVGLFGTYWDDAWHTDRGRDSFAAAPHLLLYGGALTGLAVAVLWRARRRRASARVELLRPSSPVGLAVLGALAVLASAPADELWHRVYGRDAVLWSPPHLFAVSGSAALLTGLVLGMAPGTLRARLGAALVLGAFLVPVMEYETDVPQFPAVLYLPVVAIGVALALPAARAMSPAGRWPLTTAALLYTAFRVLVSGVLAAIGHSVPMVPPLLVAAVAIDVLARGDRAWPRLLATGLAVPLAYGALSPLVPGAPTLSAADVAAAAGLSLLGVAAVVALADRRWRPLAPGAVTTVALLVLLAGPAVAHDPGQGEVLGAVAFEVEVDELDLAVTADLPDGRCGERELSLVARRAGRTIRSAAGVERGCVASGALEVDEPGRWFVYVEQGRVEGWIPVDVGERSVVRDVRDLYERPPPTAGPAQWIPGAVLVAGALALAIATSSSARRAEPGTVPGR